MKKLILLLLLAALHTGASAQIFETYKGKLKRLERKTEKDTSDIVLDPIEQVPQGGVKKFAINAAVTNWGVDLLRSQAIAARITAECKKPVTIKVADTAFDWDHFDLNEGELPGANYTTDPNRADQNGHSTHCAGIIGARDFGLCWPLVKAGLVKLKPIQILSGGGSGSFDWFARAVSSEREDDRQRIGRGESVIWSGSFGGGTALQANVEAELLKSTDIGTIFIFAAGNTGVTGVNYPGNGKYSIACASLDQGLTVSSYSTRGAEVWAAMPGRSINSTYKGNTYAVLSGTSMATPFLSGAAAIALSKWGREYLKDYRQMRSYLAWCARDLPPTGKDNDTGYGIDLVENILNKNPKDTPAGTDPDPDPDPAPPEHEQRTLTFDFTDGYFVYWQIVQTATQKTEPVTFKTAGRGSRKENQTAEYKRAQITSLTVDISSKKYVTPEYTDTRKAITNFFTNRAFGLLPKMDDADALLWAGYFLEMTLERFVTPATIINITEIKGKGADGTPIAIAYPKPFPPK
jgi:major intracellular serine protease